MRSGRLSDLEIPMTHTQQHIVALAQAVLVDWPAGIPFLHDANNTTFFYLPSLRQGGFALANEEPHMCCESFESVCQLVGDFGCGIDEQRRAEWVQEITAHPEFTG